MSHDTDCFSCGDSNPIGLKLEFEYDSSTKKSTALFFPHTYYQSYENILHGGIQSTILDAAMVNNLKKRGISALTGKLEVYYKEIVNLDTPISIEGSVERSMGDLFIMRSKIIQKGVVKTEAKGIFKQSNDVN